MPTVGPQEFKQYVIDYFEVHHDAETLRSKVQTAIHAGKLDPAFGTLVPEVCLLGLPMPSRENSLMKVQQDLSELLVKLRGSRCMLAATADRLLELSNVFAGRGVETNSKGKRAGKKNLNLNELLRISSFFGLPWTFLLGGKSVHPWYHEAAELPPISLRDETQTSSYTIGSKIEAQVQFGVTVLQSKSMNEITITTSHLEPNGISSWDAYLIRFAHQNHLNITGSIPVFTAEFLPFQQHMRTYRLILYRPDNLESRVQLYCRTFSSSTVSVTIGIQHRFYNPPKQRSEIVHYLNSLKPVQASFNMSL